MVPARRLLDALAAVDRLAGRTLVGGDPAARTEAAVAVEARPGTVVLRESGRRRTDGATLRAHDATRWSLEGPDSLWVEHLRAGPDDPTPLALLQRQGPGSWASASPHVCWRDRYHLEARLEVDEVQVTWTRTGPEAPVEVRKRYAPGDAPTGKRSDNRGAGDAARGSPPSAP